MSRLPLGQHVNVNTWWLTGGFPPSFLNTVHEARWVAPTLPCKIPEQDTSTEDQVQDIERWEVAQSCYVWQ